MFGKSWRLLFAGSLVALAIGAGTVQGTTNALAASAAGGAATAVTPPIQPRPNLAPAAAGANTSAALTPAAPAAMLNKDQLEKLVAPIALYPDDLVSLIIASSLYPVQIVEAERYLEQKKTNAALKPNDKWDGGVIALLNYPTILKMMSEDLTWTQQLADAVTNQQQDLLVAIQQLREEADAKGLLKSNDKVVVAKENNKIVIGSASPQVVYIPQYPPQMFYEDGYWPAEIYYESYPSYYDPWAPYWPGFITGVFWGSVIDWGNWGSWGGNIDVDIDWDNGRFDWGHRPHVDPRTIDRSKLDRAKFDMNKANFDRSKMSQDLRRNADNNIGAKAKERSAAASKVGGGNLQGKDVRNSVGAGLAAGAAGGAVANRAGNKAGPGKAGAGGGNLASAGKPGGGQKPAAQSGAKAAANGGNKAGAKVANNGRSSASGKSNAGRVANNQTSRGNVSRGGGYGGRPTATYGSTRPNVGARPGGGRSFSGGGGGRGGGGRGGGGRR